MGLDAHQEGMHVGYTEGGTMTSNAQERINEVSTSPL
jgi:hypothetical protein